MLSESTLILITFDYSDGLLRSRFLCFIFLPIIFSFERQNDLNPENKKNKRLDFYTKELRHPETIWSDRLPNDPLYNLYTVGLPVPGPGG